MIFLEALIVIGCIMLGARYSGIALGFAGILGELILVFGFGLKPAGAPINVILIIMAITCLAATLQSAGGLDFMVHTAEKILRKRPQQITFVAPIVCFLSVMFTGTSYVAIAVYPVICEVALDAKIRVERPLSISVIAAQHAISASPVSAATASLIGILAVKGITLAQIMAVLVPAIFIAVLIGAISVCKRGKELENDPEFQRRVKNGELAENNKAISTYKPSKEAKISIAIFAIAIAAIILFGSCTSLLPHWQVGEKVIRLSIPQVIQMIGFGAAMLILMACRVNPEKVIKSSVFGAGMVGVVATFGIAWMADTFFEAHSKEFIGLIGELVREYPILFCLMVWLLAVLLQSQGATTQAIMPIGLSLGLPVTSIIGSAPAVNSIFLVPCSGSMIAGVMFDRSGTTKIGKYLLDHSFIRPGFVTNLSAIAISWLLAELIF